MNIDTPKSDEVATGNIKEIACLIQFILGAAVNCDNKNNFIGSLMTLDEYVQGELMAYIQIILDSCVPVGEESSNMDEEDLRQRLFELEKVCFFHHFSLFNLFQELALGAEENAALRSDLESAKNFISDGQNGKSNGEIDLMERRAVETQRRLEEVQEELMMMEHQREEESIRLEVALREADEWRQVTLFLTK